MLDSTVVCRRALGCEWGGQCAEPSQIPRRARPDKGHHTGTYPRQWYGSTLGEGMAIHAVIAFLQMALLIRRRTTAQPRLGYHIPLVTPKSPPLGRVLQ